MNRYEGSATINQWGNGLAIRLSKAIVNTAGMGEGTSVTIIARKGKIMIEKAVVEPSLEQLLATFDAARHGGEAMPFDPVGREVL